MKIFIFRLFAVMTFLPRKYFCSISAGLITVVLSIFVQGQLWATPEAAIDFSQSNATVELKRTDTSNPQILSSVSSVCPQNGFVVATANGGLQLRPFPADPGFIRGAV